MCINLIRELINGLRKVEEGGKGKDTTRRTRGWTEWGWYEQLKTDRPGIDVTIALENFTE